MLARIERALGSTLIHSAWMANLVVDPHMFKALLYGSYQPPRELLPIIGMLVYFALIAEGSWVTYCPWRNVSFWGAQVIVNLFGGWLDRSSVRSIRYKDWFSRVALTVLAISFVALGYPGLQPAEGTYVILASLFSRWRPSV